MTIRILDYIEWTDPIPSSEDILIPNTKHWLRSDIIPQIKQVRLISIPHFYLKNNEIDINSCKYLLYKPALSSINGYDENYLDEINNFHIVAADISEIACELSDYELSNYDENLRIFGNERKIWYLVRVNEVFNLKDFQVLIPEPVSKPDRFRLEEYLGYKPSLYYCQYREYLYFDFGTDYWHFEFILIESNNKFTLCFFSESFGIDEDQSFITNYELTETESQIISSLIRK